MGWGRGTADPDPDPSLPPLHWQQVFCSAGDTQPHKPGSLFTWWRPPATCWPQTGSDRPSEEPPWRGCLWPAWCEISEGQGRQNPSWTSSQQKMSWPLAIPHLRKLFFFFSKHSIKDHLHPCTSREDVSTLKGSAVHFDWTLLSSASLPEILPPSFPGLRHWPETQPSLGQLQGGPSNAPGLLGDRPPSPLLSNHDWQKEVENELTGL